MPTSSAKLTVAFGPELPGVGSWEWVGRDTCRALEERCNVVTFDQTAIPRCDIAVIVKYHPTPAAVIQAAERVPLIYCPIDYYGNVREIDRDAWLLARCQRILVHCRELLKYFQPYALTTYIDHHVRYVPTTRPQYQNQGFVLWSGMRTHLPHLAKWANAHRLPGELRILTNWDRNAEEPCAARLGFDDKLNDVRIGRWTADRQLEWTAAARCAIDIKGNDFRQRHKPPAKALDFIASGLPLAMNADSSSFRHLAQLGFHLATPDDEATWLSRPYYDGTQDFGARLRHTLSLERLADRWQTVIDDVVVRSKCRTNAAPIAVPANSR